MASWTPWTYCLQHRQKKLGTSIIGREEYIHLAFRDHLSDSNTYRQLTAPAAQARLAHVTAEIEAFTIAFQCSLTASDRKFILHKTNEVLPGNEPAFIKWLDIYLKKIVKHMS